MRNGDRWTWSPSSGVQLPDESFERAIAVALVPGRERAVELLARPEARTSVSLEELLAVAYVWGVRDAAEAMIAHERARRDLDRGLEACP